ncbi:hypothetical protein H4696_003732 [Amycolatopsis lexingtonensis]|uniref:DUF3558 domain-containing protein n=1 Tax=Amycolatopsis lexingtonensis TaxID=218822 RepID=A0ABR9I0A8_9PSEU|nr:hypothetical protein [Amycolatopsis lexingtonensis]MBE1496632.1 hypothetical protein [Amycolatopsis lexingtonensis]
MSSFRRAAGIGTIAAAAVVLSACGGQQSPPIGGQSTTAATTVTATTATPAAARPTPAAEVSAPVRACASATKAKLDAALKADAKASGALVVDRKGLQGIKCAAPWAFAHFTNEIDGGSVLFEYRNGTWFPRNWGTGELCEKVPAATAERICR